MTSINISLPDSLKAFVDEQVAQRGYVVLQTLAPFVQELLNTSLEA